MLNIGEFPKRYFKGVIEICEQLDVQSIDRLIEELGELRRRSGRLFFLGVGGSAANASHAVNDFRKLCGIECYAPTDNVSELTARTNDEGWSTVFEKWLQVSNFDSKDALFIFSVGGGNSEKRVSENLINAIRLSQSRNGKTFAILGRSDGFAATHSDVAIVVPAINEELVTPYSEAFQAVIWHCVVSDPRLQVNQTKW